MILFWLLHVMHLESACCGLSHTHSCSPFGLSWVGSIKGFGVETHAVSVMGLVPGAAHAASVFFTACAASICSYLVFVNPIWYFFPH